MYVRKGTEKIAQINSLAAEENWKNYTIEVHALKSTSLSIGAVKLSEFAKRLELAGKSGDNDMIRKENDELMKLYADVIGEGRKLLEEYGIDIENEEDETAAEEVHHEQITAEKLGEYISLIENSCNDFDGDETSRLAKEASVYTYNGRALNAWMKKIAEYAEDYEYDSAMEELEKMCGELGIGKERS